MSEQMRLDDILGGSDPDGRPKDPVERQQEQRNAERGVAPADGAVKAEPKADAAQDAPEAPVVERSESRRKKHQQKERDTREAAEGRVRDPETGQYVKKGVLEAGAVKTDEKSTVADAGAKPDAKTDEKSSPVAEKKEQPQQEFTAKERAFLTAAQEERRKRQALEQQIAAMQQSQPQQEKKTFWDDPEAALQQFQQQITHATLKTKLDTSESIARTRHADFDENVAEFGELMQTVPGVKEQWLAAPDPAEFAYQVGRRQKELKQIGDIEEYRAKIQRETRAQLEAEFKAKADERARQAAELTPSLSDARGGGAQVKPVFTGPTPLDSILGN